MKNENEEVLQFETNINCAACVSKVSSVLNNEAGICHWEVNTNEKRKILSIHSTGITEEKVIERVQSAGFTIQPLKK